MKVIDIEKEKIGLALIFNFARKESVLLLADGEEFILSRADDFEAEAQTLRNSSYFQSFLDRRMKCGISYPIEDIEKEIEDELKAESETVHQHKAE
jgi:hypothetical protein